MDQVSKYVCKLEDKFKVILHRVTHCAIRSANEIRLLIMWSTIINHVHGPTLKDRNKSRDLRLLISANHEIISTPDFAASVLNEKATVLDV